MVGKSRGSESKRGEREREGLHKGLHRRSSSGIANNHRSGATRVVVVSSSLSMLSNVRESSRMFQNSENVRQERAVDGARLLVDGARWRCCSSPGAAEAVTIQLSLLQQVGSMP
jgi:hypothetical protein